MKLREKKTECRGRNSRKDVSVFVVLVSQQSKNCFEVIITMQRLFRKILSMMKCEKCEKVETLRFSRNYFFG